MILIDIISVTSITVGVVFFIGGILGVLRFPDIYCRLHALTKADNLGLGFVLFGLGVQSGDPAVILKLIFIWILVVIASATSCYLIAQAALRMNIEPWRKP
ncbi:MAG: monovalent cation/H(+) antiporter subunit G [Candidatus Omnitrophica bacterium]|nr:monovalent cation/H(+) antiporter subunit G [Candidatus Omnitrophota bacterium]MCB9720159.1 monovalent cation/H(+) antiporter subunit G [Candidatus Omnitrophota bacterium]